MLLSKVFLICIQIRILNILSTDLNLNFFQRIAIKLLFYEKMKDMTKRTLWKCSYKTCEHHVEFIHHHVTLISYLIFAWEHREREANENVEQKQIKNWRTLYEKQQNIFAKLSTALNNVSNDELELRWCSFFSVCSVHQRKCLLLLILKSKKFRITILHKKKKRLPRKWETIRK